MNTVKPAGAASKRPHRIQFECPGPLRIRLDALAEQSGRTVSELIRQALVEYLKREGVKP